MLLIVRNNPDDTYLSKNEVKDPDFFEQKRLDFSLIIVLVVFN